MKRTNRKLFIIILLMLVINSAGCSNAKDEVGDSEPVAQAQGIISDNQPITEANKQVSPEMSAFLKILTPDATTAVLKRYIDENIQSVSKQEAEKMIEYLLIYQTETIADFSITEGYFDNVYDDMNQSVIDSISDKELKAGYKELLDSSLILKFSENYPYVDTNWESLKKYSKFLPEDYDRLFDLFIKLEGYEYNGDHVDVITLGEDIISTETIINSNVSNIYKKIRNKLYETQIYNLLLGPEASHMYLWSEKNSKEYSELMQLSDKYPKSTLSKIINDLDITQIEDISDGTTIISKYLTFGLDSNKYLEAINYNEGEAQYQTFQIKMPDNKQKENSINSIIKTDIDNYIKSKNIQDVLYLSTDLKYADEQYVSYEVFLSFKNSNGNEDNVYFYRTIDYIQEKFVTLEQYLGANINTINNELAGIIGEELETSPEFVVFSDEIHIISYNQNAENAFLNRKDLVPFMK